MHPTATPLGALRAALLQSIALAALSACDPSADKPADTGTSPVDSGDTDTDTDTGADTDTDSDTDSDTDTDTDSDSDTDSDTDSGSDTDTQTTDSGEDTATTPDCDDGLDGDGDGWVDAADPDCATGDSEGGYGSTACNDGVDNEGDGDIDGEDPGCADALDDAEGASTGSSGCADGLDDDGDGWVDAEDPDCASGTAETGYGTTACNDGVDNDSDGDIDGEDPGCADATDDAEGRVPDTSDCSTDTCPYDTVVGGDRDVCYGMYASATYLMCTDVPSTGCPDAATISTAELYTLVDTLIDDECPTEPIVYFSTPSVCGPVEPCDTECCYAVSGVERYWGGRPFEVEGAPRTAEATTGRASAWSAAVRADVTALSPERRARVVALWTEMALAEHASVASFSRFSLQLMALGAPPELLLAAHRAAADEIAHARLCFGVASALGGGGEAGPGRLDLRGALDGASDPEQIVIAAVREGCVGETLSAAEAAAARDAALDPAIRSALAVIAEDEARHAALAWRFVTWAVGAFPALRDPVARALAEALAAPGPLPEADPDAETLLAFGLLDRRTRHALAARTLAEVVAPCAAAALG